nr:MAG TPA: hypothetical protein [Caudoviricetes sp.]
MRIGNPLTPFDLISISEKSSHAITLAKVGSLSSSS